MEQLTLDLRQYNSKRNRPEGQAELSAGEVPHKWVHGTLPYPKLRVNSLYFDHDDVYFWRRGDHPAMKTKLFHFYDRETKVVLYNEGYIGRDGFGRGPNNSRYQVSRAIPKDWNVIHIPGASYFIDKLTPQTELDYKLSNLIDRAKYNCKDYAAKIAQPQRKHVYWYKHLLEKTLSVVKAYARLCNHEDWVARKLDLPYFEQVRHLAEAKQWAEKYGLQGSTEYKVAVYEEESQRKQWERLHEERMEKLRIEEARKREEHNREMREKYKAHYQAWLSGNEERIVFSPSWSLGIGLPYFPTSLRLYPQDPTKVQTSLGVIVPLEEAKALFELFCHVLMRNKPWHSNGERFKIGSYYVEKIDFEMEDLTDALTKEKVGEIARWYLKAGCHKIYAAQITDFAKRVHWIP